jgi:hypothetical protein
LFVRLKMEEEKKQEATLRLAEPDADNMSEVFFKQILPYNMYNDLNVAIENLRVITTDVENEDVQHYYCEPFEYMEILAKIFYLLKTAFKDEVEPMGDLLTLYDGPNRNHPERLTLRCLTTLALFTKEELIVRHFKKLLKNKKHGDKARCFAWMVEEQIFERDWH